MFNKTFFVLSPSFHGATLLAKLLNAHPAITALGDTYPTNRFDHICGCGERVSQCGFWQAVRQKVGVDRYPGARVMLPQYPGERGGQLGRLLYSDFTSFWATPGNLRRRHGAKALAAFREDFEAFLAAVHDHTPQAGGVFVDGVKFISRVAALQAADFPVDGVIHLYRDPVDFVGSSMRRSGRDGVTGIAEHALRYRAYHARARQVARSLPALDLSYEGIADDVDGELARLFRFIGVAPMTVAELREHFGQEWHFMGNASLFKFDGIIKRSRHEVPAARRAWIEFLAHEREKRQMRL